MAIPVTARFLLRILKSGKLRHSGHDFNVERERLLSEISSPLVIRSAEVQRVAASESLLYGLRSQAAFLKSRMKSRGGHLAVPDGSLAYIRIPKCASTSICAAMLQKHLPDSRGKLTPEQVNALADIYIRDKTTTADHGTIFFTAVRNPFARIVSVYREFLESGTKPFLYEDYLFGILKQNFTFREFVKAVADIPDALKDQHLRPQDKFVSYYKKRGVNVEVLRLEDQDKLKAFCSAYGLAVEKLHVADSYDYAKYYDETTAELVRRIYWRDLEAFKYEVWPGESVQE